MLGWLLWSTRNPSPQIAVWFSSLTSFKTFTCKLTSNGIFVSVVVRLISNGIFVSLAVRLTSNGVFVNVVVRLTSNWIFVNFVVRLTQKCDGTADKCYTHLTASFSIWRFENLGLVNNVCEDVVMTLSCVLQRDVKMIPKVGCTSCTIVSWNHICRIEFTSRKWADMKFFTLSVRW
jgi:hypothetical protein